MDRDLPNPPEPEYGDSVPPLPADSGGEELDTTIHRAAPMRAGRVPKACAVLIVLNGPEIGNQFPLRRTRYVIGRAPDADIAIRSDGQISRYHARITIEYDESAHEPTYWVQDLGSLNHTVVNGEIIERHQLTDRDKIQVGDTTVRFAILDEVEAHFHAAIQKKLRFDELTGLLTRQSCDIALESELHRCAQRGQPISVLMMDIDFFRAVNEGYGHQAGSAVLAQIGALLDKSLRGFDLVSRFGGEEFLVGLPETTKEQAGVIAERIRHGIETATFCWQGESIQITISIGISESPTDGYDLNELVKKADLALYRSKHSGRNRCSAWDEELDQELDGESDVA